MFPKARHVSIIAFLAVFCLNAPAPAQEKKDETRKDEKGKKAPPRSIFPDKNLEEAVRRYVFAKRENKEPLTADDVKDISTIEARGKGIRDLTGLEKCHSLALLHLPENEIVDLGPIRELKRIQSLDISRNRIKDIGPLAGLTALQYIKANDNEISDLSPLQKLDNMRSLYLERNKIKDVKPLASLGKLWSLYLDDNQVKDIGTLGKLKWLQNLGLRNNGLSDIRPLEKLTELRYLFLEKNRVSDISTLVAMARKDAGGDQRFAPFWNVYLADNPLGDEAESSQLPELKKYSPRVYTEKK